MERCLFCADFKHCYPIGIQNNAFICGRCLVRTVESIEKEKNE